MDIQDRPEKEMICCQCQLTLESRKVNFTYLGHTFDTHLLCCPQCGEVYIPESLVKTRMAEVEMLLEDK